MKICVIFYTNPVRLGIRAQSCYLVSRMYSFGSDGGGGTRVYTNHIRPTDLPIRYHDGAAAATAEAGRSFVKRKG